MRPRKPGGGGDSLSQIAVSQLLRAFASYRRTYGMIPYEQQSSAFRLYSQWDVPGTHRLICAMYPGYTRVHPLRTLGRAKESPDWTDGETWSTMEQTPQDDDDNNNSARTNRSNPNSHGFWMLVF